MSDIVRIKGFSFSFTVVDVIGHQRICNTSVKVCM